MQHLRLVPPPGGISLDDVLAEGRHCTAILQAPPENQIEYTDDELAAQYAATDRLVDVFHRLDRWCTKSVHRPTNEKEIHQ